MSRTILLALLLVSSAGAQGGGSADPGCRSPDVGWDVLGDVGGRATLDQWCRTVGPPAVQAAKPRPAEIRSIAIVSWNMHVGGGNVEGLIKKVRALNGMGGPDVGIVLLLQEAFRSGPAVPANYPRGIAVPNAIRSKRPTPDVMATAASLETTLNVPMSAVYVPSMRNGSSVAPPAQPSELEDRGNAVFSTEPLSDIRAIELPFGRQRRVAVMCTIHPRGAVKRPLRLVSLHLDTNGDRKAQAEALAQMLRPLAEGPIPTIAAGDLNSLWGRGDASFKAINRVLQEEPCGTRPTNTWPARLDIVFGWWRGRIDFIFSTFGTLDRLGMKRTCQTLPDRSGSDHHPVVLGLQLH